MRTVAFLFLACCTRSQSRIVEVPPPRATTPIEVDAGPTIVRATVPVAICSSKYGVPQETRGKIEPTATVMIRSDLVSGVAMYSDDIGSVGVLGPRGWHCDALRAANGALEVTIEPSVTARSGAWGEKRAMNAMVFVTIPSVCCANVVVCGLITRAARDDEIRLGFKHHCDPPPSTEVANWIVGSRTDTPTDRDSILRFIDPPGVVGTGDGSGGRHPTVGVVLYRPAARGHSAFTRKLTCILPPEQSDLCEALVADFTSRWFDPK